MEGHEATKRVGLGESAILAGCLSRNNHHRPRSRQSTVGENQGNTHNPGIDALNRKGRGPTPPRPVSPLGCWSERFDAEAARVHVVREHSTPDYPEPPPPKETIVRSPAVSWNEEHGKHVAARIASLSLSLPLLRRSTKYRYTHGGL